MASITVRIPEELRKKMSRLNGVNWSEVVRSAIELEVKKVRMREASRRIDSLREKSTVKWDSVKVIREWREKRR